MKTLVNKIGNFWKSIPKDLKRLEMISLLTLVSLFIVFVGINAFVSIVLNGDTWVDICHEISTTGIFFVIAIVMANIALFFLFRKPFYLESDPEKIKEEMKKSLNKLALILSILFVLIIILIVINDFRLYGIKMF